MVGRGWGGRDGYLFFEGFKIQLCYTSKYRDPLYNMEPIVNNTVVCISKFIKRIDLTLSFLITENENKGTHSHSMRHWSWICLLLWSDSIMNVYLS